MLVLATRDSWWMTQVEALIDAEGLDARWQEHGSAMALDVPASAAESVAEALSEQLGDELRRRAEQGARPSGPLLLEPAFAFAIAFSALLLAFAWITGAFDMQVGWFARGALVTERALAGEWWRLVTAATLHADGLHAASNAGFFIVLGWAAAERFGAGVALVICLTAAIAGFGVSLAVGDADVTVGASGGLFGLLGAAAGNGLRRASERGDRRRYRLRVIGSALLLLAFTAVSERANIEAHLGGFAAGGLLGLLLPRRALAWPWQIASAVAFAAGLLGAWSSAGL